MELLGGNESDAEYLHQEVEISCDFDYAKNLQEWTDQEIHKEMIYSTLETVKMKVIVPIIFVVGILGNSAFFLLLARVKTMRTLTNFYLANLAIADIMVLFVKIGYLMSSPYHSVVIWSEPFRKHAGCALHILLCALSYCASILLITFISFDRYFAICRPIQYRYMKNKKRASVIIICCIWIVSAIFSIPIVMRLGKLISVCIIWPSRDKYDDLPDIGQYCDPFHPVFKQVFYVLMTIPFTIALITNTILYIKIVNKLKKPLPGDNTKNPNHKLKQRITWMLLINSIIFFCCLAPTQFLILTAFSVDHPSALHTVLIHTAFILIMVNSAVNPIIYVVANPSYRRGFFKAFGVKGSQVEPSEEKQSSESTKSTQAPNL